MIAVVRHRTNVVIGRARGETQIPTSVGQSRHGEDTIPTGWAASGFGWRGCPRLMTSVAFSGYRDFCVPRLRLSRFGR